MLKKLFTGLFGKSPALPEPSVADPALDPVSEQADAAFAWDAILPTEEKAEAVRQFILAITGHLEPDTSARIAQDVIDLYKDPDLIGNGPIPDLSVAIREGAHDCLLSAEWKQWDELEMRANGLLADWGFKETWRWTSQGDKPTVEEGFRHLADWVSAHGLTLLHLQLDPHVYYACFVRHDELQTAAELASAAGIEVWTNAAFEVQSALRHVVQMISAHLGADESERIADEVIRHFQDPGLPGHDPVPDPDAAISEGLLGESGQTADQPLMIAIDHRAAEEIAWQANALLAARGIEEEWDWEPMEGAATVMHAFSDLATWLASRNLALLHLDLGSDAYQAFFVETDRVRFVLKRAEEAKLKVFTHEAFRLREQF